MGRVDRIRGASVAVAVLLGALQTVATRHAMNPDGISYLDMAQAVLRRDWVHTLNGLWSPLYAWIVAFGLLALRPPPQWLFPAVHLMNFVIFLAALLCFQFFLNQILGVRSAGAQRSGDDRRVVDDAVVVIVGHIIFVWSSLNLIWLGLVTPDLAVSALVYLASGALLRIRRESRSWSPFAVLGLALGLGYLAKAPLFPLAFVFFAGALFPRLRELQRIEVLGRAALMLGIFAVLTGAMVSGFYALKGRVTIGDSGRLNYAWHINRVPFYHWQGHPSGFGTPVHSTRQISRSPAAYEFTHPVGGTYPPWFDPAYWYEGVRPRLELRGHLAAVIKSVKTSRGAGPPDRWAPSAFALLIVMLLARQLKWLRGSDLRPYAPILLVVAVAICTFALVHLEPRYVAAFMTLLWVSVVSALRLPVKRTRRVQALGVLTALMLLHMAPVFATALREARAVRAEWIRGSLFVPGADWQVAEGLKRMGVQPGDRVAIIGSFGSVAYWAHLAKVRVVAEVFGRAAVRDFWRARPSVRNRILRQFADAGAKVVVHLPTRDVRVGVRGPAEGWRPIGGTNHYLLATPPLRRACEASASESANELIVC